MSDSHIQPGENQSGGCGKPAIHDASGTIKTDFWSWNNNCSVSFVKMNMFSNQVTEGFPIPRNRTALNMTAAKKPCLLTNNAVLWTLVPSSRCAGKQIAVRWSWSPEGRKKREDRVRTALAEMLFPEKCWTLTVALGGGLEEPVESVFRS